MSDPTDPGGVGAHGERGRQPTRVGDSGSPVGSPLTIVLALIAVVVGFLIFRSIDDSDAGGADGGGGGGSTTVAGATSTTAAGATTSAAPATTAAQRVTDGATVIVANASNAGGMAAAMSEELDGAGYTMAEPGNATGENLETTVVYFVEAPPQIRSVAQSVARDLGGVQARAMPGSIPVEGGSIGTATVLVMLGNDLAGDTLEQIAARSGPNVQAPAPAGNATTTG
jgi:LytR cell envelope-related transcriptional attenuator